MYGFYYFRFYEARGFEAELKIANKKHDIIALRLYDKHEEEFPNLGLFRCVTRRRARRIG